MVGRQRQFARRLFFDRFMFIGCVHHVSVQMRARQQAVTGRHFYVSLQKYPKWRFRSFK